MVGCFRSVLSKTVFILALTLALFVTLDSRLHAEAELGPSQTMRSCTDEIFNLLKASCKPGEVVMIESYRPQLAQIIDKYSDFREMSKRALGRFWKQQPQVKQDDFSNLFRDLLYSTYMERAVSYQCSSERIVFEGEKSEGDYAQVDTRVGGFANGALVSVDYRLTRKDGEWKVYDVVVEGISFVNNYRSQIEGILAKGSFDDLLSQMREKVAEKRQSAAAKAASGG